MQKMGRLSRRDRHDNRLAYIRKSQLAELVAFAMTRAHVQHELMKQLRTQPVASKNKIPRTPRIYVHNSRVHLPKSPRLTAPLPASSAGW